MAKKRVASRPRPGAPHERLDVFVGRWRTRGRTTDGTALEIRSADDYEWFPGGFFVIHRWTGRVGDAGVKGLEVIGYDAASRDYRTHFFDDDGNAGTERLTVRGRTWTWLGRRVMGSEWHRCTSVVSPDGRTMTARHERSSDGRRWSPWMDVELRRRPGSRRRRSR